MEEFEQLGGWSNSQFREEKRVGTGFRGWGLLGSGGSRFQGICLYVFNLNIFGTSNFGKMRLISLLIFFSDD